jgi:hypothetical protein
LYDIVYLASRLVILVVEEVHFLFKVFELSLKRSTASNFDAHGLETYLDDLHRNILDINENLKRCQVITNLCFSDLAPRISWLPPSQKHLQMTYLDGNTPWEIWFTYQDMTQFNSLSEILKYIYNQKLILYICLVFNFT